jgi:two-component system response regulator WspF
MRYGALDAVNMPILDSHGKPETALALLGKITTISKLIGKPTQISNLKRQPNSDTSLPTLVAIGSSTGGPKALATILSLTSKLWSGDCDHSTR